MSIVEIKAQYSIQLLMFTINKQIHTYIKASYFGIDFD